MARIVNEEIRTELCGSGCTATRMLIAMELCPFVGPSRTLKPLELLPQRLPQNLTDVALRQLVPEVHALGHLVAGE